MSPTLRTRTLLASLCASWALAAFAGQGHAQGPSIVGDAPFSTTGSGNVVLGNAPVRIWHRTKSYGEETSETGFGAHGALPLEMGVLMIDGQLRAGNSDQDISTNLGLGYRWMNEEFFTGNPQILGASVWYDGEDTKLDNYFNQVGVSLERLGERIDFRANGNIAIGDPKLGDNTIVGTTPTFSGNILGLQTLTGQDVPLRVFDFEAAPRIRDYNVWAYGGGYQMDGEGVSEFGWKSGVRGYIYNDLVLDVGVTDDDLFGTNTSVQIIWTPGRTSPDVTRWVHSIEDRMREQVYRNMYVATTQRTIVGAQALTNASGNDIRVVHVDSSAAAGGDGTFERPLNTVASIEGNSEVGDIILVHAGSLFENQTATLQDAQRLLGEGDGNRHTVVTQQLGSITIPETAPGAANGSRPVIDNDGFVRDSIVLAGATVDASTLAEIEVSNLRIEGGTRGIATVDGTDADMLDDGVADVNINRMEIVGTTSHGIDLRPLTETLPNNSTRSRFTPTIDKIKFENVVGDDIHIVGTTTPQQSTIVETITISDIESDDGHGVGISLDGTRRAVALSNINWDGGTTGAGAILVKNNIAQSVVTLSGTNNAITGGQAGDPEKGYAIRLENAQGAHVVSNTTITNTGGASIQADGGGAGLNFTGRIDQANNAAVVNVTDGHTGTLIFNAATGSTVAISATNGTGLQFNNADGSYTFNNTVTLNNTVAGGDAGIDVTNGSAGTFVFNDTDITDPVGSAINIDGSSAVFTHSGAIATNSTTAPAIRINANTGGSNTFTANSTLTTSDGRGVEITNNTGGTTLFSGAVNLVGIDGNGAGLNDDALTLTGNSAGSATFANLTITNPTGIGVNYSGNSGTFTFNQQAGTITGNGLTENMVVISGNTGDNDFTTAATINADGSGGILITNNTGAGTTNTFGGVVTLADADGDAVAVTGNSAGGTTFANLNITNPVGGSAVQFTGNSGTASFTATDGDITTDSTTAPAIQIGGPTLAERNTGGTVTFGAATSIEATGQGIRSENNTGGTYAFNGAVSVTTSGTSNGVTILNNTGGSTSFANIDIDADAGSGEGFTATASGGHTLTVTGTGNTIVSGAATALRLDALTIGGGGVNFASVSSSGAVNGIVLNALTGGAVNIGSGAGANAGGSILNSTGTAILVTNVVSASFNEMVITGTAAAFDGIAINHTNATAMTVNVTNSTIEDGENGVDFNRSATAASRLVVTGNAFNDTADEAVEIDVSGTNTASLIVSDNTATGGDDSALSIVTSGGTNKTTTLLVDGNTFNNNSATGHTIFINNGGTGTMNATVTTNTLTNTNNTTGRAAEIASTGASSTVRLNLDGNTGITGNANDEFLLRESAGTFRVEELATVDARNPNVEFDPNIGAFEEEPGTIPQP